MLDAGAPPLLEVDIADKQHAAGPSTLPVIAQLSFALPRGEVTCLLGPSGCGKTTALRIVMGLDRAYSGRIQPPPETLKLGVVFQDARLLPWRSVVENVRLAAPQLGEPQLRSLLEEVGLAAWVDRRPNQLSGGMARRVALARALAIEPDLLVLDEAFVSLDEQNAKALRDVTFQSVQRRRTTVLMVTHDLREALEVSDRILLLGPRPTRVIGTFTCDRARNERSPAYLDEARVRLLEAQGEARDQLRAAGT